MRQIKIKNFGPIKEGYTENDGFMDIKKVTTFIGNQGSGKSTVVKLLSTMMWLEKALYQGKISIKEATSNNRFVNQYCDYHNLKNYFDDKKATEISYKGVVYDIIYKDKKLTIVPLNTSEYAVPQIMYIPAERNFLSAVKFRNLEKLKELPSSLFTFLEELERSQNEVQGSVVLPIENTRFEFDKLNETANIVGDGYKLKLSEASSGFQSFVPLFLVSHNLSASVHKERTANKSELSSEEQRKIETETLKILSDASLSLEVKTAALKLLSAKYKIACFVNIVEEIEQNLFPDSQKQLLFELLTYANNETDNALILTTHSPYIINYLNLAIQGAHILAKMNGTAATSPLRQKLEHIVPIAACLDPDKVAIYEMTPSGSIRQLETIEGIPSDTNYLNQTLADGNTLFGSLLDIEAEL